MESLDVSRIAELSRVGLLADKALFALEQNERDMLADEARGVFDRLKDLLLCAIKGLKSVQNLRLEGDTALAVGAYELVTTALRAGNAQAAERDEMRERLVSVAQLCEHAAAGTIGRDQERSRLTGFLEALSDYTSQENSALLRQATRVGV